MMETPAWKGLAESVAPQLFRVAANFLDPASATTPDLHIPPQLALFHLNAALNASIEANNHAQPSVAVCLLRQCVEALTLVDVGLQPGPIKERLIGSWNQGTTTIGGLRAELAKDPWKKYGPGIWGEPWEEFFASLARAVQPYAHYSPELMGWQIWVLSFDGKSKYVTRTAHTNPDPVKATRLSLMQAIVVWTLGKLLHENRASELPQYAVQQLLELGLSIADSDLLFKTRNWADELLPHVVFMPGKQWRP